MTTSGELADEIIEADVLVIGGGLAGCVAAIRAKENKNVTVALMDKAATPFSGSAGRGLDHFSGVAHEIINVPPEQYAAMRASEYDGMVSTKLATITARETFPVLALLESIGIKVREEDGTLKMLPGKLGTGWYLKGGKRLAGDHVFFRGADLKTKLAAEVRRRGVRLFERTMLTSLITKDGSVVGATGLNTRTGRFLVFKAKATLLCTGGAQARMYSPPFASFPNSLFYSYCSPNNSGGGHAAAYRAGAKMVSLEYLYVLSFAAGFGTFQGAYGGPMFNSKGENIWIKYAHIREQRKYGGGFLFQSDFLTGPDMAHSEAEREVWRWPSNNVDEGQENYGYFAAANEWPFVNKLKRDRGGGVWVPPDFEFHPHLLGIARNFGGVLPVDDKGETSLKGMFVAGDAAGAQPLQGAPTASGWGYRIGTYLGEYTPSIELPKFGNEQISQVRAERERVYAPLKNRNEENALEVEDLSRRIMSHYCAINKTKSKLERCLELLGYLKRYSLPRVTASNPHELMRALEVQEILDVNELHARTSLMRDETRIPPYHYREDHPEPDDAHWKGRVLVVWNEAGEMKSKLESLL